MDCEYLDCKNKDSNKCLMCVDGSKYEQTKKKTYGIKKNYNKQSKRMGSKAESIARETNCATIDNVVSSRLTKNSGASYEKSDVWIEGLVNIAQEVKTQEPTRAKGCKTFTIHKEWLDKLDDESKEANQEFWYLIFSFKNTDEQQYVIIDNEIMQGMVATLIHDRKIAKEVQNRINLADKKRIYTEAENLKLQAEIDMLKAEIKLLKEKTSNE